MNRTINCPSCGNPNTLPALSCEYCNADFSDLPENRKAALSASEEAEIKKRATAVILTTANNLEGYRIVETLEIITAECVYGMNLFLDLFVGLSDVFGGRSQTSQRMLRDARRTCLNELKREAAEVGANAVIAVDLDYSEFSGKGKSMLFLVASGTAVKVERIE
ncbi:MAG: YbjQ family protein [Blastocatellia bacterium]|nr:YbjQ family protein [Blastocatellia bacterium]